MEKNYVKRVNDVLKYFGEKGQYVDAETIANIANAMNRDCEPIDVRLLENSGELTILSFLVDQGSLIEKEEIINGTVVKKYMLKEYADRLSNSQQTRSTTSNNNPTQDPGLSPITTSSNTQNNSQSTNSVPSNNVNSQSSQQQTSTRTSRKTKSRKKGNGIGKNIIIIALAGLVAWFAYLSKDEIFTKFSSCIPTACSDSLDKNAINRNNGSVEIVEEKLSLGTAFSDYITTGDLADPAEKEAVEAYDDIVKTGKGELTGDQLRCVDSILGNYYTDLRNNPNAEPTNVINALTNGQFTGVVDNTSYESIKESYEEIVTQYVQYNVDNDNVVALDVESKDVANMTILSLGTDSKTYYALPNSVQDVLELNTLEVLNSITIDKINENMHVENIGDLAVVETGIEVDYNGHKTKLVLTVEMVDYLYQNVYNDLGLNKGISPCK